MYVCVRNFFSKTPILTFEACNQLYATFSTKLQFLQILKQNGLTLERSAIKKWKNSCINKYVRTGKLMKTVGDFRELHFFTQFKKHYGAVVRTVVRTNVLLLYIRADDDGLCENHA